MAKTYRNAKDRGCWNWFGYVRGINGYARCSVGGKSGYAHRIMYELFRGPIPEGLQIDHLCKNRMCVNPMHLQPVSLLENLLRGPIGVKLSQTHCKRGHPLFGDNLRTPAKSGNGRRICKTCATALSLVSHWRLRGITKTVEDVLSDKRTQHQKHVDSGVESAKKRWDKTIT
jgi:hypothetical protein